MCFEIFFAKCQKNNTRQIGSLPSVKKKHSAKKLFAECQKKTLGKEALCRVSKKNHSAKSEKGKVNIEIASWASLTLEQY